jgi:ATP-binding cassette, subfamily C, bacterial
MWGSREFLRLVRQVPSHQLLALLFLTVASSLAEGFGILLLVPLIGVLTGNSGAMTALPGWTIAANITSPGLLLAGFAGLLAARTLFQNWQQSKAAALQRQLIADLRLSAMRAILQAEWRWLSQQRISENSAAILSDLTRLSWGIGQIPIIVGALVSMIVYLTVSVALSWSATLLALVFGGATYAAATRFRKRIVKLGEDIGASTNALHEQIEDTLAGAKLIKSLGREQARIDTLGKVLLTTNEQYRQVVANSGKARILVDTASAVFLTMLTYAALFWMRIPPERLLPLIIIFARFVPLLGGAQQALLQWLNAVPALRNVTSLIEEAKERAEPMASGDPLHVAKSIVIEAADFSYHGSHRPAIKNLSLALPVPSTTAITGPSGAGKSTLADILGGLIAPDAGRLLVDGIAINGAARVLWRQSVAYVHQDAFFFDGSVAENLRLAKPLASDEELYSALASAGADFVATLSDALATGMGNSGSRFSGGERQRIALARAMLLSPALLILDEATSALDPETEAIVVANIEALRGSMTIVVVSHRPLNGLTVDQRVTLDVPSKTTIPQQLDGQDGRQP